MKRVYFFSPAFCLAVSLLAVPVLAFSMGTRVDSNHISSLLTLPGTIQGSILLGLAAYFTVVAGYLFLTQKTTAKHIFKSVFYIWLGLSIYGLTNLESQLNGAQNAGVDTFDGDGQQTYKPSLFVLQGASCGTIAP